MIYSPEGMSKSLRAYAEEMREAQIWPSAISACHKALSIDSRDSIARGSLACCYWNMGLYEECLEENLKCYTLTNGAFGVVANLAMLHHAMRRYTTADKYFEEAMAKAPGEKERISVTWDRAQMRLERGQWRQGFEDYEARIPMAGDYVKLPAPLWKGEDLSNKSLWVQMEQGLGDRILLSRYFAEIKRRWPTCTIKSCFGVLADLFYEFRDIVEDRPDGVPYPDMDYGVYQASLPGILGSTPGNVPPDPGFIKKRLEKQLALGTFECPEPMLKSIKVGVAWTGNSLMKRNNLRSIPFEKILTLAEDQNVTLYSFQVGSEDISKFKAGELIHDFGPELKEYGFVAGGVAMSSMDIIVTVCTGTAHYAGALGLKTLTLLSWDPYWVWLQEGTATRKDSVWYPNTTIIRQSKPGDWDGVIKRAKKELDILIGEKIKIPA